jgi:hypothetical protein
MKGEIYKANGNIEQVNYPQPDVTLKFLQNIVGGYIQIIHFPDGNAMVMNEEGKLDGLPENVKATKLFREAFPGTEDFVVGDVLLTEAKYIK